MMVILPLRKQGHGKTNKGLYFMTWLFLIWIVFQINSEDMT